LIERIRAERGFKVVLTRHGLTETCGIVSLCADADAETIAPISGKTLSGIELRCVDTDNQSVPAGESGEVVATTSCRAILTTSRPPARPSTPATSVKSTRAAI